MVVAVRNLSAYLMMAKISLTRLSPNTVWQFMALRSASSLCIIVAKVGVSLETSSSPIVALSYGSFRGQVVGTTAQFLGMPFAAPPYVVDPLFSTMHFHRSSHTALVNVALVFRNLPYLSLAYMMQLHLDHLVISKQ
jgi:hypothetical protein